MLEPAGNKNSDDPLSSYWCLISDTEAVELLRSEYGIDGTVSRLSSERDDTFVVVATNGDYFTLKVANPAEQHDALDFQSAVLVHLAAVAPDVPVPRIVSPLSGGHSTTIRQTKNGALRVVRLLTYLHGEQQYRTPGSTRQNLSLGRSLASLGLGLQSVLERPPEGKLLWDITHTLDLAGLITHLERERRPLIEAVLDEFSSNVPKCLGGLRKQLIHNDFNPYNILVSSSAPSRVVGIIDFGDIVYAPLVNDLAVAISYHLATSQWRARAGALIRGFNRVRPLLEEEIALLPVLTKARLAMTILITEWRASSRPENRDYILRNHGSALQGLLRWGELPTGDLSSFINENCEA